jgi:N-acetylglucosamine-6-phosphate deacetylase
LDHKIAAILHWLEFLRKFAIAQSGNLHRLHAITLPQTGSVLVKCILDSIATYSNILYEHDYEFSMANLLIHDIRVLVPGATWERGWILIDAGRIAQMGDGIAPQFDGAIERIDGSGLTTLPGFIDVHVHGSAGHDTMDATPAALAALAGFYATHGVTGFLATTMTGSGEAIRQALENGAACVGPFEDGATLLGVHLEGPYLNVQMKGAQAGRDIRTADPAEYRPWLDLNVIRQVTVAPEFPENHAFIRDCVARGIVVSMGHTAATFDEVRQAVDLGVRQATHTFNAMTPVHHRTVGTAGAVLSMDEIACELITDTIHVHPAILKMAIRAKGIDRIVAITDAIRGAGMPDGQYDLGGQLVTVCDGMATIDGGSLAGSTLTMDRGLRNILAATGLSLSEAWPMTSANAAAQLGIADRKGRLAVGHDADIVLLDHENNVRLTIAEGRVVYRGG